jgi:hypothetical protein
MNKVKCLRSLTMKYKYSYKINEYLKYSLIIPKYLLKRYLVSQNYKQITNIFLKDIFFSQNIIDLQKIFKIYLVSQNYK